MNLSKNASVWLASQYIVTILVSFIILKLNLDHFGTDVFGIWLIISSILGVGTSIDFGFGLAVTKYLAEFNNSKDAKSADRLISTSAILFAALGIVIVIIGYLIAEILYFNNPKIMGENDPGRFRIIFIILCVQFYFQYINSFFKAFFEGLTGFVLISKLNLLNSALIFAAVLIIVIIELEILWLAIAYLTVSFIIFLLFTISFLKSEYKFKPKEFDKHTLRKISGFSFSVQAASIFGALIDPVIKYILGDASQVRLVATYEVARRFSIAVSGLFSTSFRTLIPKMSILKNKDEYSNAIQKQILPLANLGIIYSILIFGCSSIIFYIIMNYFYLDKEIFLIFMLIGMAESINNFGYGLYIFLLGIGKTLYLGIFQGINLMVVSLWVWAAVSVKAGIYIFGGYFFSVLIINIWMIKLGQSLTSEFKINYFYQLKLKKLLIFLIVIITLVSMENTKLIDPFWAAFVITSFSFMLIFNEIKMYAEKILFMVKGAFK